MNHIFGNRDGYISERHSLDDWAMEDSSPEPLDDIHPISHRMQRATSVKASTKPTHTPLRRTGTLPSLRRKHRHGVHFDDRLDMFGSRSYLRVPAISGRTSPSVASINSEPDSCMDGPFDDDDVDIGQKLFDYLRNHSFLPVASGRLIAVSLLLIFFSSPCRVSALSA
ncbi:hypothetical protein WR25_03766 [Diploscapter pachys]|uniref:Uncharacterized protein n=1 Tax=Diploscapter pachys TaxID=2018661 RepID=A0A2A2LNN5_9BILA|nr:hypothetical protein WR25_03766 [Diploscapter pachys]